MHDCLPSPLFPTDTTSLVCSAFLRVGSAVHTDLLLLRSQFGIECDRSYVDLQASAGGIERFCMMCVTGYTGYILHALTKPPHPRSLSTRTVSSSPSSTCCRSDWPDTTGGRVAAWGCARSRTNSSDEICARTCVSGGDSAHCCAANDDADTAHTCVPGNV